jgi:hypothetical protein
MYKTVLCLPHLVEAWRRTGLEKAEFDAGVFSSICSDEGLGVPSSIECRHHF